MVVIEELPVMRSEVLDPRRARPDPPRPDPDPDAMMYDARSVPEPLRDTRLPIRAINSVELVEALRPRMPTGGCMGSSVDTDALRVLAAPIVVMG